MSGEFTFETKNSKTYATIDNARKAVAKAGDEKLRHFYMTNEHGRFFPVFIGEAAVQAGVHFRWHVVG
jgi:hypothetical protein